ncbi:MAG TPA: sulfurtransferase-like selenium metabolism protein YedF [Deltaproteobacteria bacterium]|nr:sulfurtransferase-like selenium metabolism protein YedF [Deltaproteobacteria bacterium]
MEHVVDARGQACPQPVIMAKQALAAYSRVVVYVDNDAARENVRRMGAKLGCEVTIDRQPGGVFHVHLSRSADKPLPESGRDETCQAANAQGYIVVLSGETMGKGSDELGAVLIKAFIHTLLQMENLPSRMLFYNTGVKLAVQGSPVLDDLKQLSEAGVEVLVCGTCLNFFGLTDQLAVGGVTNMYEIATGMASANRILSP